MTREHITEVTIMVTGGVTLKHHNNHTVAVETNTQNIFLLTYYIIISSI